MDHPQPYSDTDPRAMEVWLDLLRKKSLGDKLKLTLDLSRFALQISEMGVRSRYPQAGDREVFLRVAALHLSRDLMIRAYGWDPEQNENSRGRL
jgi:hypothetical protein